VRARIKGSIAVLATGMAAVKVWGEVAVELPNFKAILEDLPEITDLLMANRFNRALPPALLKCR
jgi:hypothetical protein